MFWNKRTYLDYAAGALGNPSSPHEEGRSAKEMLEAARTKIARLVEVKPDDIVFTSGATEANNLAIQGLAKPGTHFLYLPSAHASIVNTVEAMAKKGVSVEALPIKDGRVDIAGMKKLLRPETALISTDAVCGETGTIWNTREVKNALPANVYLHVDASQAPLTEKMTRAHFNADILTLDGAKLGVRGIGALIAHRTIPLAPIMFGGGQERGLRSGTENPESAEEFAAALGAAASRREAFRTHASDMRAELIKRIQNTTKDVYINEGAEVVPHILSLSFPGRDTDYLVALLDEAGFTVSTRSACETDSEEGSRAVFALTGDQERAKSTLRISWGSNISTHNLMRFASALQEDLHFIDNGAQKSDD